MMSEGNALGADLGALAAELQALAGALEDDARVDSKDLARLCARVEDALRQCRDLLREAAPGEGTEDLESPEAGKALPEDAPKILVVDDDDTSRGLLANYLSRFGTVEAVSCGTDAVAAATRTIRAGSHYGLIFLDLMMPEMDGQEALTRIRRLEEVYSASRPAVIAMTTAVSDREAVLRARKGGSAAYFVKPLDLEKLGNWVEEQGFPRR